MSFEPPWKEHHKSDFDELACPRCGRETVVSLIVPRVGRSRWCRHCKILFDKLGVLYDVLAEYDKQWLDEQE